MKHERVSVADSFIPGHRVGYELRFVDEHERVSVADSFIPAQRMINPDLSADESESFLLSGKRKPQIHADERR